MFQLQNGANGLYRLTVAEFTSRVGIQTDLWLAEVLMIANFLKKEEKRRLRTMVSNLKNRPSPMLFEDAVAKESAEYICFASDVQEWFESFEKNQRDILEATWEWCEQTGLATDTTNIEILRTFIKKEVLGEV